MTTIYTKVPKATGTSYTKVLTSTKNMSQAVGSPIGLLLALTYATAIVTSIYTKVSKASGTVYTKVAKAT